MKKVATENRIGIMLDQVSHMDRMKRKQGSGLPRKRLKATKATAEANEAETWRHKYGP